MQQGWAKIKKGATHADVCERTFRKFLKKGLRHTRLPSGTILIKYEWIDEYLEKYEVVENKADRIVDQVCKEFGV